MKTLFKNIGFLFLLMFFASIQIEAVASVAEDYITINGVVKDSQTKKKLEYVTITIPGSSTSTISNVDGEFSLKVKLSANAKEISCRLFNFPYSYYEKRRTVDLLPSF